MSIFDDKQIDLDLNGPILSFTTNPTGVGSTGVGINSTGGGTVEHNHNQKILKTRGVCIFLDCSVETLKKRILSKTKNRPMLYDNPQKQIEKFYTKRYSLYEKCANITINTDNLSALQTVREIIKNIE